MIEYEDNDVVDFGALGYGVDDMAKIIGCSISSIEDLMRGEFGQLYEKGAAIFEFEMDKKLMSMALGGDIKSLAELEKRKRRKTRK